MRVLLLLMCVAVMNTVMVKGWSPACSFACTWSCETGGEDTCGGGGGACSSNPCMNGASCSTTAGGYTCQCAAGYTGAMCQTNIDDCLSQPCLNSGTCTDGINQFTCQCSDSYTGERCETSTCPPGFSGEDCDWHVFRGKEYYISPYTLSSDLKNFDDARASCLSMGAELLFDTDADVHNFIINLLPLGCGNAETYYIGLVNFDGIACGVSCRHEWEWLDGTTPTWTKWTDDPDSGERVAYISMCGGLDGDWYGIDSDTENGWICGRDEGA